ncbi:MAG: DUF7674 family protein [Acidimicrobiia bacterium]
MSETNIDLVDRLVGKFPVLEPLLREHLADNFGEVLPHVFFGDLSRYVVATFDRTSHGRSTVESPDAAQLRQLIGELDEAFVAGPDEVSELIAASFLENLPREGETGEGVRALLGPRLRSELERMG